MEFQDVVEKRRAYRAFDPEKITDDIVNELLRTASLAPSCNNNQPWKFIMVRDPVILMKLHGTLSRGNYWMKRSSMIVAVVTEPGTDCEVQGVAYEMFDTGMATALMMLKATDLGLISHPIAGFDKADVKEALNIPESSILITLIGFGSKSDDLSFLGEKHQEQEITQRKRKDLTEYGFMDRYH